MGHYHHLIPARRPTKGFSLLEVLIAMVVLSIGLLGLAGLQVTGLRYNHSAYLRSQATLLTYNIIDRMRGNRNAALNGSYDLSLTADLPSTAPSQDCAAGNCTTAQLAAYDLYNWSQNLQTVLPSGDAGISVQAGTPSVVTVTVQWDETWAETWQQQQQNNNNPITQTFTVSTVL